MRHNSRSTHLEPQKSFQRNALIDMSDALSALEGYPSISQEPLGSALIYCVIVVPSSSAQIPAEPEKCHWVGVRVEHFLREDYTWSNVASFSF